MTNKNNNMSGFLNNLHKYIPLKQRYLMTKTSRFRLRYTVPTILAVSIGCLSGAYNVSQAFSPLSGIISAEQAAPNYGERASFQKDTETPEKVELANATIEKATESDNIAQDEAQKDKQNERYALIQRIKETLLLQKEEEKRLKPKTTVLTVDKGDTLAGVLIKAGMDNGAAYQTIKAMSAHYDPRRVRPGQKVEVHYDPSKNQNMSNFSHVAFGVDPVKTVIIERDAEKGFTSEIEKKDIVEKTYAARATIQTSLFGSALKAGIPSQIVAKVIRAYSWDIDFQRDIRSGDTIEILYEAKETSDGHVVSYGDITYANLSVGGHPIPIYEFAMADGNVDFFKRDGRSIKKTLMKTPIDGARLSSGYGMRKHPILGYNKMHKGVDFAASLGTPIYAAGDGVIEKMERQNGYGNYMRIRHNSSLKTAYAHIHKFGKNMGIGKRVKQGEVIAYVGSTGRSTGPHLHYEVLVNNKQVSPNRVDLPIGEKLKGDELKRFEKRMRALDQQYVELTDGLEFAGMTNNNKTIR